MMTLAQLKTKATELAASAKTHAPSLKVGSFIVAGVVAYTALTAVSTALLNDLGEEIIDTVF